MNLIIFNTHRNYKPSFFVILFSTFFPFAVYSACGTIPATYPLFSGEELELDEDISINGNPVDEDDYSPNAAIDANGNVSTSVSLTLPDLDPNSFPSNNSNSDLEIENTSTINHTSEVYYDKIEIEKDNITVNFTGGGVFHIEELEVKDENVTLNFAAGTYYINKFKINDEEFTLNVTSSPVIFHIGDEFNIDGEDTNINTSGNVDDFLVYLHSGAKFESKKENLDFTGLIYGPNVDKVEVEGEDSTIHGAIIVSGGKIELKEEDISFTYTSADQTAIGNISTCENTTPTPDPTAILEYKFDACSLASTVEDTQGSFDGTATGTDSTDSTSVLGGRSLDLSATDTSDWVTVPKSAIDGLNDFSFSVWIKTGTYTSQQEIFQALGSDEDDDELEIYLNFGNTVIINLRDDFKSLATTTTLTDDAWHHLVLTRESDEVCLYVDGSQTDCKSGTSTGTLSVSSTNSVVIGQEQDSSTRSSPSLNSGFISDQSFKGYIDELKIYDSVLSSSQVQTLYNDESSGNNTSFCSGGGSSCVTFRDEFSTESYSRQDGTANWSTDWNEVGDNDNVSTGNIEISSNKLRLEAEGSGSTVLGAPFIEREADLSSYTTATLSFDYSATEDWADEENDEVKIYASSNGGSTWTLIHTFTGTQSQSAQQFSQDISAYIASNIRIAFVEKGIEEEERFYLDNIQIEACAAAGGGDTPATAFNCVENGADGISGNLFTKTTAQSFSFDIVALRDALNIEEGFASGGAHTVAIELVDVASGASCSAYSALSSFSPHDITFTSADSGTKASLLMTPDSSKAYREVKCRVTDATDSPSIIGCSTDSFAIRPTEITISSNLTNANSTGTPTAKAGENFTLTATATAGYDGTPNINASNIQAHAGAVQTGIISGTFDVADSATGIATGTAFSYSEVGSLQFTAEGVYDDSFTAVDQPDDCTDDFSNTKVSGKIGCKFGNTSTSAYFGRFIPHHFVISEKTLVNRSDLSCSPASGFTYSGEKFQAGFKLTAENIDSNTTQNYTGSYAKLDNGNIANFNFGAIDVATSTELTASLSPVSSSGTWTNGVATITASLGLARSSPSGPYNNFNLGIAPTDSDGTKLSSYDLDTDIPSDGYDRELLAATKIRFGRLNIDNAHGSELMALPVPLYTEYYNGTSFITHTDDLCTEIAVSDLSFNGGTNPIPVGASTSTASIANLPLAAGVAGLSLSAPGVTGYIDIATGAFISSYSWLGYDWDGDGNYDDAPSARATFGIYKGNSQQIYFREVY